MTKHTQTIRPQIDFDSTGTYNENIESIVYRRHPIWRISVFSQKEEKKKEKKRQAKTAMKLYPFIYDHYPRQIDGVP